MTTPEQMASDWIAYARLGPDKASEDEFADGWEMVLAAMDEPLVAWEAIKLVLDRYSEEELNSEASTEAQEVIGLLAAGPIEDLLSYNESFIDSVEAEAHRDGRMAWALGGVWQCGMSD